MSLPYFDSPYREEPATHAAPARDPSSRSGRRKQKTRHSTTAARSTTEPRNEPRNDARRDSRHTRRHIPIRDAREDVHLEASHDPCGDPYRDPYRETRRESPRDALRDTSDSVDTAPTRRRSSRRRRRGAGGGATTPAPRLTSLPTTRTAYVETRLWLLSQHGPVCAYCGRRFSEEVMTLDHVQPRRGQTAYDRRDNLVLACPGCNGAKRDLAPLAFLLGARTRAVNLLRYGAHLSPMLRDMARALVPADLLDSIEHAGEEPADWELLDDDGTSPYRD